MRGFNRGFPQNLSLISLMRQQIFLYYFVWFFHDFCDLISSLFLLLREHNLIA